MTSVRRACVFLAWGMFAFFPDVTAGKLPKQPETDFRFNCGSDFCTFPIQYCNQDANYCSYCQTDLCVSQNMPEQCRTFCDDYLGKFTSSTTSPSTKSIASTNSNPTDITTIIALWMICGVLIVILLLIVGLVLCFCRRKQNINNDTVQEKVAIRNGSYVEQVSEEGELGQIDSCLIDCNLLKNSVSNSSKSDSDNFLNTLTYSDSTSVGIVPKQNTEVRKPLISRPHEEGEHDQHENFGETRIMNKDTLVNIQERRQNDSDSGFREKLCMTTTNVSIAKNELLCATEYHRYPVSRDRTEHEEEETQQKTPDVFTE